MNNIRLLEKTQKGWWSLEEIASLLSLSRKAASVFVSRSVDRGDLKRLKRGLYVLPSWLAKTSEDHVFRLSNLIQTPSYISLLTALSFYGVSTQLPQSSCEAISKIRSIKYEVEGFIFSYRLLPNKLFTNFERQNAFFIATPEKALADTLYLTSLGRYALDKSALDLSKIDLQKLRKILNQYPSSTIKYTRKYILENL
ncbi:MAG: type IV toxin-antitoxin system AbiEi family antitoxin domain-containing protein [Pseudomonadota bacterium]